jgi:hypothetical protein
MQMTEELTAAGVDVIDPGAAAGFKERLKSYDILVAEGMVARARCLGCAAGV